MQQAEQQRHPFYDNPRNWFTKECFEQPTFNVAKFQKRLNRICGTSDGKPIVELTWAWNPKNRDFYYVDWDSFGRGVKAEFRYKYRFASFTLPDGDTIDVPPPRWILSQRYEPGQYAPSWEASRWMTRNLGKDEKGNNIFKRFELRPEMPPDGWYSFLRCIADHNADQSCCTRAFRERRAVCWGYYREPAQFDLDLVEDAVKRRNADPCKWSPHEPLPPEALAELERGAFEEAEQAERADKVMLDAIWHDWAFAHGWRAFEDSVSAHKKLTHGKYHDLGRYSKQTPAGLYLPIE